LKNIFVSRAFILCAFALLKPLAATASITIDTVPVGNLGNPNDPATGNLSGRVSYAYNIGKYDVTVGQYTAFLNAVAATDTYGLYNASMATDLNVAGIAQTITANGFTYSVIGSANHPITYASWGDAARFANWLQNGQPTGAQNLSTTEDGAYFLNGAITNNALNNVTRKAGATWFIPTENEWYKAAYYNPATSSYYQYPTSSNLPPSSAPPGSTPNTGNFKSGNGAYALTGSTSYSSTQNYLTDIGAYTASASPYGAFDMGGDLYQWNEALALVNGPARGLRGGSFYNDASISLSSFSAVGFPADGDVGIGFRLASVPEPSTAVLATVASLLLLCFRNPPKK
jgi:formylglycine-generating enzyme